MLIVELLADVTSDNTGEIHAITKEILLFPTREYALLVKEAKEEFANELDVNYAGNIVVNSVGLLNTTEVHNEIGTFTKDCNMEVLEVARIHGEIIFKQNWVIFGDANKDISTKIKDAHILRRRKVLHHKY